MSEHHRTSEWAATVRKAKPIIAASLPAPCVDCRNPVTKDQRWQVGHIVPVTVAKAQGWTVEQMNALTNLGPTHTRSPGQKACNQIAGGRLGAAKTNTQRKDARRLPNW